LLLFAVHNILDGSDINTNVEFQCPGLTHADGSMMSGILKVSMAETHELVVARVKDNDSPIDSYGLCPCLQKINTSALLYSNWYYKLHVTCRSIF
jgi:hypothetical protein